VLQVIPHLVLKVCPQEGGLSSALMVSLVGARGYFPPPSFMKIYCWNVKGLNSPFKQHEVVSLMKKNKLDVCGLVETKLASSVVSFMHKLRLRNLRFLSNVTAINTACILVFWNPSTVKVELIDFTAQGFHVTISSMVNHRSLTATFVYGYNTVIARRALWEDLQRWNSNSPLIILGDSNSLLSEEDKHNGEPVSSYEVADFRTCCSMLGLSDLNFIGSHFTWTNGKIWSKIVSLG
jgi:hypothetical protein